MNDIKSSYRALVKLCHPDLNKNIDPKIFHDLTESYNWLLDNHKPKIKIEYSKDKYYEFFDKTTEVIHILVGEPELLYDTDIFLMNSDHYKEYRVKVPKGTKLPLTLRLSDVRVKPLYLRLE